MRLMCILLLITFNETLSQQLNVAKIAEGVYVHTSSKILSGSPFPSNGLLVETENSVFLVDTPWDEDQTLQLIDWVRTNLNKPIIACIVTHWHDDRVTGTKILKEKYSSKIYAFRKTADILPELGYDKPDVVLPNDSLFSIDKKNIRTFHPGAGHTHDNIIAWLPDEKILFGGCFVKSTQSKTLGNIADANLKEWPASVRKVRKMFRRITIVVPGHQSWSSPNSLSHTLELLKEMERSKEK